MAAGPHPLLRLDPAGRPAERTTGVRLTGTGPRVLAGQADQIALNGTDRWIGGVHLQRHHMPWRWDGGTETIVRLPRQDIEAQGRPRAPTFTGVTHRLSQRPNRAVHLLAVPAPWGLQAGEG